MRDSGFELWYQKSENSPYIDYEFKNGIVTKKEQLAKASNEEKVYLKGAFFDDAVAEEIYGIDAAEDGIDAAEKMRKDIQDVYDEINLTEPD